MQPPILVPLLQAAASAHGYEIGKVHPARGRIGTADAVLLRPHGRVEAWLSAGGCVDVAVRCGETLVAWSETAGIDETAHLLHLFNQSPSQTGIKTACGWLTWAAAQHAPEAVAQEWRFLLSYGDDYLAEIAAAIWNNVALRVLRPWVSHGTLHLLPGDHGQAEPRGLAIHPQGHGRYRVRAYGGGLTDALQSGAAAAAAARAVRLGWRLPLNSQPPSGHGAQD